MSKHVALFGEPNSGKSYSRTFLDGETSFVFLPSDKAVYLYNKSGEAVKPLTITVAGKTSTSSNIPAWIKKMVANPASAAKAKITGNFVFCPSLEELVLAHKFVSMFMPHIKVGINSDFTHYLTNYMSKSEFADKKGYDKFTTLAIKTLKSFFVENIPNLRSDLVFVTEFHIEHRSDKEPGSFFIPAGNMLRNQFKPESYFDYAFGAVYISPEVNPELKKADRFKFQTLATDSLPHCRDGNLFEDFHIPNNLKVVVDKIAEKEGLWTK